MDLNHRSAGYEPAGISWLSHPATMRYHRFAVNHCDSAIDRPSIWRPSVNSRHDYVSIFRLRWGHYNRRGSALATVKRTNLWVHFSNELPNTVWAESRPTDLACNLHRDFGCRDRFQGAMVSRLIRTHLAVVSRTDRNPRTESKPKSFHQSS